MMELSTNSMTSPMATNNPYSPTAQQSDLSYSPGHTTIPTKLPAQSPLSSQNSSERQNETSSTPNQDDQIASNDHQQHSVTNFINHSTDAENETDKSQVKFIEESQLKSTQPSPMDFQSNNPDDDNKHKMKSYNQINKESSPTHINNIEHDIKFDNKNNEDKNVSETYNQHVEGEIERHSNQHLEEHSHHHLTQQHHHSHHQQQQPEPLRENVQPVLNLNGSLPHEHLERQNEPRHQLQSQPQYHSPHHLQEHQHHQQQQQQHMHHQLQQHHHNLGLHDHQAHLQHLDSQHHQPYKLYVQNGSYFFLIF